MDAWKVRHQAARKCPHPGHERALGMLIDGLREYAEVHQAKFESPLGEDWVLGDEWLEAVRAVVGLLNGEIGRLDGGSLWQELEALARSAGFDAGLEGRAVNRG